MGKQAEQDAPCVRYCKIIAKHTKDCSFSWSFLVSLLASWQKFVTPIWKRIFCYFCRVARLDMANLERNFPFQRWKYPSLASASGNSIDLQNLNVYLCFFIPSLMLGIWVCTISATAPYFECWEKIDDITQCPWAAGDMSVQTFISFQYDVVLWRKK